jgi:hypothetical protein
LRASQPRQPPRAWIRARKAAARVPASSSTASASGRSSDVPRQCSAVLELVDRLVREGLVVREPSSADRRKVELRLTSRGRTVLAKLARMHRAELQRIGPLLKRFFGELSRPPKTDGSGFQQ